MAVGFHTKKFGSRNNSMKNLEIRRVFNDWRGSKTWAAARLRVPKSSITEWVNALKSGAQIPADRLPQLEALAIELERTSGACMDVARPAVKRIRARRSK